MHKKISYGGIATALCLILTVLSAYSPSGKAALLFMASVTIYLATILTDKKTALISYGAASILLAIFAFSAQPVIVVSFCVCFGNYPVLAVATGNIPITFSIICKAIAYVIYFSVVYYIACIVLNIVVPFSFLILFILGIPVFVFYDWLLRATGAYAINKFFHSIK